MSRKRILEESCPAEQPIGGKCEATVRPDVFHFEDGTEYNIGNLTDEKVSELVSLTSSDPDERMMYTCYLLRQNADLVVTQALIAAAGGGTADVPAEFQVFRRSIEA